MKVGLLHPGAMGVSVGTALAAGGQEVLWLPEGRSDATARRAADAGFRAAASLQGLVSEADGIVSVCPPDGALALVREVMACDFQGLYVDANAVAPDTARAIATQVGEGFVDGGIIGPPATRPGGTRLYLSGPRAAEVAGWFAGSFLDTREVAGSASALKMCYAAYTKGTSALLLGIRALAAAEGVEQGLLEEWALSQPDLAARSDGAARGTAPKAWRFEGEMEEIAATFAARSLPAGFHQAAADIYARMAPLKEETGVTLERVLEVLNQPK